MNVLSLCDGASMGQQALKNLGIPITNYFASEIDKAAIQVTQKNHPNTIQIGDIRDIKLDELPPIDLLIGGTPCQNLSPQGNGVGLLINKLSDYLELKESNYDFGNNTSYLFWEYVYILRTIQPKKFLLENVKMKSLWKDIITKNLKVSPTEINSNILSCQNRPRLYWANRLILTPKPKNILIGDVLIKDRVAESFYIDPQKHKHTKNIINQYIDDGVKGTAMMFRRTENAKLQRKRGKKFGNDDCSKRQDRNLNVRTDGKMNCLLAGYSLFEHSVIDLNGEYRKTTPTEWERFQTLPEGYTEGQSNTARYSLIGNGWTVKVIEEIFSSIL